MHCYLIKNKDFRAVKNQQMRIIVFLSFLFCSTIAFSNGTEHTPADASKLKSISISKANSRNKNSFIKTDAKFESIKLIDNSGKEYKRELLISPTKQDAIVNTGSLNKGLYFIEIQFEGQKESQTERLIVE